MITILFATYNGADTLPLMLDAFCQLIPPENGWKIIAVDNASTDNTKSIIASYANKLPITYLYEKKQGKNHAINRGLSEIEGDLVILTDDDIIPDTNWIIQLVDCAENHTDADIFSGAIKPHWPTINLPEYIDSIPVTVAFGFTENNCQQGRYIDPEDVFGGNMMVRSYFFDQGIMFDESVGPSGKNYAMGSETEFTKRLVENYGAKCFFCPSAIVKHIIHPHQITQSWLAGRAFRSGRGSCLRQSEKQNSRLTLFNVPLWMYNLYIKKQLLSWLSKINIKKIPFSETWKSNYYRGYIYQSVLNYLKKNK